MLTDDSICKQMVVDVNRRYTRYTECTYADGSDGTNGIQIYIIYRLGGPYTNIFLYGPTGVSLKSCKCITVDKEQEIED